MSPYASFAELCATPRIGAVCYNALRSFGYTREHAQHEGMVELFFLYAEGIDVSNPRGLLKRLLFNREVDTKRLWQNRNICFPGEVFDVRASDTGIDLRWFWKLTEKLAHKDRTFLYRRFVLGMSYQELSCLYSCALGTVKSRTNRTIGKLKNG